MTKSRTKRSNRIVWILIAVVALGAGVLFVGMPALGQVQARSNAEPASTVSAFVGDLQTTISASGKVAPASEAQLAVDIQGKVESVFVQEGDRVAAGDPLVRLETDALERAVTTAEQNLVIQQASLEDLLAGASETDIAAAQANLDSANANLEKVLAGAELEDITAAQANLQAAQEAYQTLLDAPDENTLAQARAKLLTTEAVLQQAQAEYDQVSWRNDIGALPQSTRLQQATTDYEAAKAAYDDTVAGATEEQLASARASIAQAEANLQKLLNSPTEAEIASATAQVEGAQTTLTNLLDGASSQQIAIAEAQVELARISLEDARDNLEKATLTAPMSGVVTAVHVSAGEYATGIVMELADMDHLEIVLDVDEVDLGVLEVGQPAILTLESRPAVEIKSEIASIAPRSTQTMDAIVSFEVRLSLTEPDPFIRIGMTVDADLVTASEEGVLLVPNSAITADRQAGAYYVNLVRDGPDGMETQTAEVVIGLRDRSYTQILAGIDEGDQLLANALPLSEDAADGGFFMTAPREQMEQLRAQ